MNNGHIHGGFLSTFYILLYRLICMVAEIATEINLKIQANKLKVSGIDPKIAHQIMCDRFLNVKGKKKQKLYQTIKRRKGHEYQNNKAEIILRKSFFHK